MAVEDYEMQKLEEIKNRDAVGEQLYNILTKKFYPIDHDLELDKNTFLPVDMLPFEDMAKKIANGEDYPAELKEYDTLIKEIYSMPTPGEVYSPFDIFAFNDVNWKSDKVTISLEKPEGFCIMGMMNANMFGNFKGIHIPIYIIDEACTENDIIPVVPLYEIKEEHLSDNSDLDEYFTEDGEIDWEKWPYPGELKSDNPYYVGDTFESRKPHIAMWSVGYSRLTENDVTYWLVKKYGKINYDDLDEIREQLRNNRKFKNLAKKYDLVLNTKEEDHRSEIGISWADEKTRWDSELKEVDKVFNKVVAIVDEIVMNVIEAKKA